MNDAAWNMYVFRDGRRSVGGVELVLRLSGALARWSSAPEWSCEDCLLTALIAAGELECALLDSSAAETDASCSTASEITDALAGALLTGHKDSLSSILQKVGQLRAGERYEAAVQEGFAYYALHPGKVATLIETMRLGTRVCVLGIRSIGVTLSAVACASLAQRGIRSQRISVRPTGHPYDRKLEVTPGLRRWLALAEDAEFLVLDEGPGISGSSFLAVAEALESRGVAAHRIHMIGSREVDPATLRTPDARRRWERYNFHIMKVAPLEPPGAGVSVSGGLWRRTLRKTWRRHFDCAENAMPAVWAPMEPASFLARNEQSIFRFEGFGHYGESVGVRAALLGDSGFAPSYLGNLRGFGEYALVPGRMLNTGDLSPELLEKMSGYLALRSTAFANPAEQTPELNAMLRWNWQNEFGEELGNAESQLSTERVVVCDGRLLPHAWLCNAQGELLKLDAGSHGDNHFFPGPCDIAWDIAGAIVEWELQGEARDYFVREYTRRSGDAVAKRLGPYLLAYATFRMGWSRMAAAAMRGEYDEALLERDYRRYRAQAQRLRQGSGAAQSA
jgi:hypothetical protein